MKPSKHDRIGFVLWEGPSLFDGAPIVVIATGLGKRWRNHGNGKTGDMIQTWVLRADVPPTEARRTGADRSICGPCPLKGNRGCYVSVTAPTWVYKAYQAGSYYRFDPADPDHLDLFRGRTLRIGAYGDPAATPLSVWKPILDLVDGWTGYTHAWRSAPWQWREYVQASVSDLDDAMAARVRGYRTFRILKPTETADHREMACPLEHTTCEKCQGCHGGMSKNRTIPLHGSPIVRRSYMSTLGG